MSDQLCFILVDEKGIEPSAPALRILKGHFGEDIALVLVSRFA
jgi:hypothetical protein